MSRPMRFGRYLLDRELGRGGMGTVYAARDTSLGDRAVAIKVINEGLAQDEGFLRRFHAEAAALASLNSPHVIAIHEHGEIGDRAFLATQFVSGGSLSDLLAARGPLPPAVAADVCAQIADALTDAHAAGIVHRDVKPANVLIRDPQASPLYAYLCDFGIAQTAQHQTTAGGVTGSFGYLAPERLRGERATPATDLYSLGCTLWACLTGRPPYTGADASIAMAHLEAPPPQLAAHDALSARVNELVSRMMAKDPRERYASAAEAAAALRTLAATASEAGQTGPMEATMAATPLPDPGTATARTKRRWVLGALAGAVLLGLLGAGSWWAVSRTGAFDASSDSASNGSAPTGLATRGPEPTKKPIPGLDLKTTRATTPAGLKPLKEAAPDYNDDGYADLGLAETGAPQASLRWWSMTPDGISSSPPVTAASNRSVWGDFDGDGRTDTASVTWHAQKATITVSLHRKDGRTQRSTRVVEDAPGVLESATTGDFDGDGRDDLALTSTGAPDDAVPSKVLVAPGTPSGVGRASRWLAPKEPVQVFTTRSGDSTRDGLVVVTGRFTQSRTARTYRSTGRSFVAAGDPAGFDAPDGVDSRLIAADFTGDAETDLAWMPASRNASEGVRVLPSDGQGGFGEDTVWVKDPMPATSYVIGAADVDQDGTADLVQLGPVRRTSARLSVRLSDGTGFGGAQEWKRLTVKNRNDLPYLLTRNAG